MKALSLMLALSVLLLAVPVAAAQEGSGACPPGYAPHSSTYAVMRHYVPACIPLPWEPTDALAVALTETAGRLQAEKPSAPCGMDMASATASARLACQPTLAANAAAKPAGLAQAAPVRSAVQGWPGCPYGYDHDPKCQSGPAAAPDTVPKPVGLAQLAPVVTDEKAVPCAVWMASLPQAAALLCTR